MIKTALTVTLSLIPGSSLTFERAALDKRQTGLYIAADLSQERHQTISLQALLTFETIEQRSISQS